jgi:hypothetical protein
MLTQEFLEMAVNYVCTLQTYDNFNLKNILTKDGSIFIWNLFYLSFQQRGELTSQCIKFCGMVRDREDKGYILKRNRTDR